MQVGGERLGRVGIAVAGVERRGRQGQVRRKMEWSVEARGMEGSGTVGIVEAWQAGRGSERYDKARSGGHGRHGTKWKARCGLMWTGTVTQARSVQVARRKVGMAGEVRSGEVGWQDAAGEERQGSEAKGNAGRVEVRQVWSGRWAW